MTKPPINLQDLRRRIYRKAKSDKSHRFWGLFVHIAKIETLEEAYRAAKRNGGAPGVDGQTFEDIEQDGTPWKQAGINPCRTGGSIYRKGTAKFARFKFLAYAIAWCKEH